MDHIFGSANPDGTAIAKKVAEIYANIIGVDIVNPQDDIFSLNGDSHQAVLIALELESIFGIEVPIEMIGEIGTVYNVAAWVSNQISTSPKRGTE